MFLKVIGGWQRFSGLLLRAGLIACLTFLLTPLAAQNAPNAVGGSRSGPGERDRAAARDDLSGPRPASPLEVPAGVRLTTDVSYRDGNPAWRLDLAMPEQPAKALQPGIVFVHGGGWRGGDKRQGYFLQGALEYAQKGYVCITVNYRLTGEAPFPACIEDVKCAVRWLRAHAGQYNVDPNRIGAYGNSAGAHLVALLGLAGPEAKLEGDGPYQGQSSRVQAVCCSATPTDFLNWGGPGRSFRGESTLLAGPAETLEDRKRQASPISYVNGDAPAFLIVHGMADTTVPFRQGQSFAEALKRSGARDVTFLEFEGSSHGVFMQRQDATHPAMEGFFARTLMHEPADLPDRLTMDARADASQPAERMNRSAGSPQRDARDRKAQRPRDQEPSWLMPPVQGPNLHYKTFDSKTAGQKVSYLIYLPPDYETTARRRYPVVYWLHGIGGSQQGVPGMAERLTRAIEEGKTPAVIVVYVNGMIRSGWSNSEFPVETVAIEELIPHVDATYRTIATREGRMIEGFSMGGSGAAKWGFKHPDLFGSISILDGALRSSDDANDPWKLAEKNAERVKGRTTIRIVTRTAGLSGANEKFHDHLQRLGLPSEFHKIPNAPHAPNPLYEGLGDKNWEFYRQAFARSDEGAKPTPPDAADIPQPPARRPDE